MTHFIWQDGLFRKPDGDGDGGSGSAAEKLAGGGNGDGGDGPKFDPVANFNDETFFGAWLANAPDDLKNDPAITRHKTMTGAMGAMREAQAMVGADKLVKPKGPEDTEALNAVYSALGRPDTHEGYQLDAFAPEGGFTEMDKAFHGAILPVMHQAGVTQDGLALLAPAFTQFMAGQAEAKTGETDKQQAQDWATLEQEWGQAFDERVAANAAFANRLGLTEADLTAAEAKAGTAGLMRFMEKVRSQVQPSGFGKDGDVPPEGFKLTPAEAKAELAEVEKKLQPFAKRAANGEKIGDDPEYKTLMARKSQLNVMIHGDKPVNA